MTSRPDGHDLPATLQALLGARVEEGGDGHLLWTGPMDRTCPYIKVQRTRYAVRRLILQEAWGRGLQGEVAASCGTARCVAPAHLLDEVGRRNTAALDVMLRALDQAMPALLQRAAATRAVAA
ncbi:hypothetical protein ACIGZJ_30880 [Kitasatospora sp. NPDC052868]|uniref:hypothetical protein n=1 Tax=Kitasatospora sp. NPDC052868 TaxID=3364060 RepID=UPI0037C7CB77